MSLLVTFPFCAKDADRLLDLLTWCGQLGKSNCPALLVSDPDVPWTDGMKAMDMAAKAFASVQAVCLESHVEGWIPGSVALFRLAAEEAKARGLPWLFLEPDAVPLCKDWVDQLDSAYQRCGKPFMGPLISHQTPGKPSPYLEGVSVYPANAIDIMAPFIRDSESWTYSCAPVVVPQAVNTPLIHHVWGMRDDPPTFAPRNIPGTSVFALRQIPPEAVLWHRCKDESLIRLLREKMNVQCERVPLLVVFPFCGKDVRQFAKTVGWMRELNPRYPNDALLSWENTCTPGEVKLMKDAVTPCFASVFETTYPPAQRGQHPASVAFRHAAHYASRFNRPWLWCEFDMIPLKANWLDVLEKEYYTAGKAFMGPIVPGLGHMNGTGVYPSNTPTLLASALTQLGNAWDVAAKAEMEGKVHDCSRIFQHVWGMHMGKFHPYLGNPPMFRNSTLLSQISPTCVVFHRSKDGSLIDRLRERKR